MTILFNILGIIGVASVMGSLGYVFLENEFSNEPEEIGFYVCGLLVIFTLVPWRKKNGRQFI